MIIYDIKVDNNIEYYKIIVISYYSTIFAAYFYIKNTTVNKTSKLKIVKNS